MATKKEDVSMEAEIGLPPLPPLFTYMVASHTFRLDGFGHHIRFEPNKPIAVYRDLQPQALAHGARAIGGEAALAVQKDPDPRRDPTSTVYQNAVREAAEALLAANMPSDFGANGKPYANSWRRELGWLPVVEIRDRIWDEVRQAARAA